MKVLADKPTTEKALKKLIKTMQEHGAWFHEDITLTSENGGLLVELNGPCNPAAIIMRVPTDLLVPVAPLNMTLQGDDFVIAPDEKELTPVQIELGEVLTEIYNLTGRPAFHRNECVWTRYRDHAELLEEILKARTLTPNQKSRLDFARRKKGCDDDGTFVCDTFWQSRVLGHKSLDEEKLVQKVMPFVDYLDHHHSGSPFVTPNKKTDEQSLRIQNQRPFLSSSVLYACYGMYDALDTLLTYGFIDTETPVVRAVPMKIELEEGKTLNISSLTAAKGKGPLNKHLKDLQRYSPIVTKDEDGNLGLSHVQITLYNAPNAMRRILRSVVRTAVGDNKTPEYIIDLTYRVEREIVENTIDFYRSTLENIQKRTGDPENLRADAIHLCKVQLAKLYKYFYNENFFTIEAPLVQKAPAIAGGS